MYCFAHPVTKLCLLKQRQFKQHRHVRRQVGLRRQRHCEQEQPPGQTGGVWHQLRVSCKYKYKIYL